MSKPIFRFTIGSTIQQGLDILQETVFRTIRALGEDNWDWVICYNGLCPIRQNFLQQIVQGRPIAIYEQKWSDCPIQDKCWSPFLPDGTIEQDGAKCGGTLWKICPPRMRIDSHEIIMDNDLVILKEIPQIEMFLKSNKTLILEEPIRFYGRYDYLIQPENKMNSGLMGLPPGFDFGKQIRIAWEEKGQYHGITQADEQGLLMYVLQNQPNIRIKKEEIKELLANDNPMMVNRDSYGLHFVQSNRAFQHHCWNKYQEVFREPIPFF